MSEPDVDFPALRELLETNVNQPTFDEIRTRRSRRTRGLVAVASVAVVAMVVAVGTALAVRGIGQQSLPPGLPDTTTTMTPDAGAALGAWRVESLTATPSGRLYAVATCDSTEPACDFPYGRRVVMVSDDLAATWTTVGDAPASGQLLAGSDSEMWIVGWASPTPRPAPTTNGIPAGQSTVEQVVAAASTDGGRTWQRWVLDQVSFGLTGRDGVASAGGTTWVSARTFVYAASGPARPVPTESQPPGIKDVYQLVAIGPDHAVVMGARNSSISSVWFETNNRGAQWKRIADPCAGTPQAGSLLSTLSVAPDGSWWAGCVSMPDREAAETVVPRSGPPADPTPVVWPRQIVVSTDGGSTWQKRGPLTDAVIGWGLHVFPRSATMAWRTSSSGDIARTVDGRTWTTAAAQSGQDFMVESFVALDQDTAVYILVALDGVPAPVFRVTRDGGATWTTHRMPAAR